MTRALLDVNVLIALLDSDHTDHRRVRGWVGAEIVHGWASCAITRNGFVRIIIQPRYPSPVPPAQAIGRLARAAATGYHEYGHARSACSTTSSSTTHGCAGIAR
ncbi:PIN domain-containing protein [Mycobacterium sp. ML4]